MNELQLRLEAQEAIDSLINSFMLQNNIPPHIMEDALNKVMLSIKEQTIYEFINAAKAMPATENSSTTTVESDNNLIE